ncbi:hypothetical protein Fmac_007807 [Flemingia macrophylla]|uniref:Uncharacterized protein n=1 Tax=Flemingia macrophylla TaxID=520843 RepID=A0ABD1MVL2_9FABA
MKSYCRALPCIPIVQVPEEPFCQVTYALIIELSHRFVALHAIGLRRYLKTFLIVCILQTSNLIFCMLKHREICVLNGII